MYTSKDFRQAHISGEEISNPLTAEFFFRAAFTAAIVITVLIKFF